MPVAFNSSIGEIRGDGWDRMDDEERSKYRQRCQISVWFTGALVFLALLYLLLLAVIIGLMTHNKKDSPLSSDRMPAAWTQCDNLTQQWIQLQMGYNRLSESKIQLQAMFSSLTDERDALRHERDRLKSDSSNLTAEMELLQSKVDTLTATRDQLQEEVNKLNLNRTEKLCPERWKKFNDNCYYVSPRGVTNDWQRSKVDCEDRAAHLVTITTRDEQDFVSSFHNRLWIGLSDRVREGVYKWVDGTDLVGRGFWQEGEPNDSERAENCVELSHSGGGWNDMSCTYKLAWVCKSSL